MLSLEQMQVTAYLTDGGIICTDCLATRAANGEVVHHDGDAFYANDHARRNPILALCRYVVDTLVDDATECDMVVCDDCHTVLTEVHIGMGDWRSEPFDGCYCTLGEDA